VFGEFVGHGGFGLIMGKQNLLQFYEAAGLGITGVPLRTTSAVIVGFEMVLVCMEACDRILVRSSAGLWCLVGSDGARQQQCCAPIMD
jgi:hypothetical protein